MTLTLPQDLEDKLSRIADYEKRSPVEILRALLEDYSVEVRPTLADLAQSLAAADYHSGQRDTD